jgi:3',5'-cyclic AMP phosphodiesterase CpdA
MTLLLQVSDTHFGTEQPPVVQALLRLARAQSPRLVLVSGDVTQRARRGQFERARRFVDALGAPCLAVPGNHDIPLFNVAARLWQPHAGFRRCFGPELEPRWQDDEVAIAGVNTTRWWRHKHGEVSAAQVGAVARWLRAAPHGALRIVMTHHPLLVTRDDDRINRPRAPGGATEVAREWSEAGADVILGGHIHLPYFVPLDSVVPGLARRTWMVQAGTAVSRRVRPGAPNSLNLIRRDTVTRAWRLERWDFDAAQGEFACAAMQPVGRD